jgi:DNA-binding GntR family transcriptional regulator
MNDTIFRAPDLRGQLRDQVEKRLRLGLYPDDVRLMEHAVAREFNVSRTPAREALAMLAREGMLEKVGRGYRRVQFSVEDIEDLFEVRERLEPFAVQLLTEKNDHEIVKRLQLALRHLEAQEDNPHAYMDALAAFRRELFDSVGNERLVRLIFLYETQVGHVRAKTLQDTNIRHMSISGNRLLVAAIARGDGPEASRQILKLLTAAKVAIVSKL